MSSENGLERAPVFSLLGKPTTDRGVESMEAFRRVTEHQKIIDKFLSLNTEGEFEVTTDAIEARKEMQRRAKEESHRDGRSVHELALVALSTVSQMEDEFRNADVLDIGCGLEGRFATAIARNSRANVVCLDSNPKIVDSIRGKRCTAVVADGRSIPFENDHFDRTIAAYSSLSWSNTPLETAQSFNEAMRVTKPGGAAIFIPIFSNTRVRDSRMFNSHRLGGTPESDALILGEKVWAVQDHILFHALKTVVSEGLCSITWSGFVGPGMNTGHELEVISAIVDKKKPIPAEILQANLDYAEGFTVPS
jgi:SAM-dependent methyltransferase